MRHCATGRHRRYRSRRPYFSSLLASVTVLGLLSGIGGLTGAFSSAAATVAAAPAMPGQETSTAAAGVTAPEARAGLPLLAAQARIRAAAVLPARPYTVRPGDSLSAIALRRCGVVNDWTGIFEANRAVIGPDPNLIRAGQELRIACTDPPALLHLGSRHAIRRAVSAVRRAAAPVSGFSSSVVYSYAMLEQIWQAAGGPAWAAPVAACIAIHESGGRPWAVSPTDDFGLWQVNGSHGALATLNAFGNARAAVIISSGGQHWGPWTTRPLCAAPFAKVTGAAPIRATLTAAVTATRSAAFSYVGARILNLAQTRLNDPYSWGGAGPSAFDCSGIVSWAAAAAGERSWPRDTYGIAAQIGHRFAITYHPVRGDLAMWGPASAPWHVEIVVSPGMNFGAETYGWAGRVTWHSSAWFRPWFYLRILW